ncbi:Bifunctional protein PutA [Botrimarina colliarenosi]|uniref:L-glutamate gamma-semialdehyde dehydrogenase n=2 Tax=Botrimarina colliarenosi TaxID=2528001 RepID=A0A5C6AIS6_9BACT|nr:Bifunctional protein PutA [Botrimarina colliarenosi]
MASTPSATKTESLLDQLPIDPDSPLEPVAQRALLLASKLQERAGKLQTPQEKRQQAELDRMLQSPGDKATLVEMTDQAFRAHGSRRSADQLIHILDVQGVPRFFSPIERGLLAGFQSFGGYMPGVAMPLVKDQMQRETANVVLPAEPEHLRRHLQARRREGLRMNVNHLGEALLGEAEAKCRLQNYLSMLGRDEIEVMSVKASTLFSQITPIARRHTVGVLADRLETLFQAAAKGKFTRPDGTVVPKFVYLDMEEYRDMRLTFEAFRQALNRPGLENVSAGIVLQAYLPDAFAVQKELCDWARRRVAEGGAAVTLRIVKGANMEMERVEASLNGWRLAPFSTKAQTDANYLRMLREGLRPENLEAVRLGVASHNLFTVGYALAMVAEADAFDRVQFEMLEGMANHQRRAVTELAPDMLLYAPACRREEFLHAIGYLVRRLDENTGPDNFLRHAFNIQPGAEDWRRLESQFIDSLQLIDELEEKPHRRQDRRSAPFTPIAAPATVADFVNEPDTEWAAPHHSEWAESIVSEWADRCDSRAETAPLAIAGEEILDREGRPSSDPSRPGVVVANYRLANDDDVDRAVACAASDPSGWRRRSPEERRDTLAKVADLLAERRGELLGVMLAEGAKLLTEGDPEVSEAIDFCRFYGASAVDWSNTPRLEAQAGGVVAVVSPWNFPLAIPCGGVAAALAAGNTVILKPASHTVLTAWRLCRAFWDAGVPREALQFVPCSGAGPGERLVTHPAVDHVLLTGGTETARRMLAARPDMRLLAETGGKNATIVTAMADRELAIAHVVHSAFGHGGQKCSATSLLVLEDEVYHDRPFREMLIDAVSSLRVGSAWDLKSRMAPLIDAPSGDLLRGLTELEEGESWAVTPRLSIDGNPAQVSPGVKWGVRPGSYTHTTEFFGPVLGVMRARHLQEAINLVNATGYGLTSGLESLDDREHTTWLAGIQAGNLYINRSTTGAIVLRQPFGGRGLSAVGPGVKAGGPNYVATLMRLEESAQPSVDATTSADQASEDERTPLTSLVEELQTSGALHEADAAWLRRAAVDYAEAAEQEFLARHDHFELLGQDNVRRYLPFNQIIVRLHSKDTPREVIGRVMAARSLGCRVVVSSPPDLPTELVALIAALDDASVAWGAGLETLTESDEAIAAKAPDRGLRLRYAAADRVPAIVREPAAESLAYVADAPVSPSGRLELLWCVQEQSVSHDYHRYGNLGRRSEEPREAQKTPAATS